MKKSRTVVRISQDPSPFRRLPLVDLLVDTRTELFELAVRAGLRVFTTMLEEDRTAICGPRYRHQPGRFDTAKPVTTGRLGTPPTLSPPAYTKQRVESEAH